jgi:hypothetical protein
MDKWLKKLGIKSYEDLNAEEKETYKEYELALSGKKLTDKEIQNWLQLELDLAVSRITDTDLPKEAEIFRKMEVKFIKKIINYINSPVVAKEYAQKAIEQLIK